MGPTTPPAGEAGAAPDATGAATGRTGPSPQVGSRGSGGETVPNMLPGRKRRRLGAERILTRLIATCGVVAIGVAIAAIMTSSNSKGWIIGLVVSIVSVVLSAILWSSRQL